MKHCVILSFVSRTPSPLKSVIYITRGLYIGKYYPPPGEGGASDDDIWGKKYEKAKEKAGKCERKKKKGEQKRKKREENEKKGSKRVLKKCKIGKN
jgi:hypothetical protein